MVSKGASIVVLVVGVLILLSGLGMSDTKTISGSTSMEGGCVDTPYGDSCYDGSTINSETTVENPNKGPTILSGLVISLIGFVLTVKSDGSDEGDQADDDPIQQPREVAMDGSGPSSSVNADRGSTTEYGSDHEPHSTTEQDPQRSSEPSIQTRTMPLLKEYSEEIKFYGSIVGGAMVTYWVVSFLFGPTFIMEGFIGRIVTLLSLVGGSVLGYRFHERQFKQSNTQPE